MATNKRTFTLQQVAQKVRDTIAEQLAVDEEEITGDASFYDDLGADSLDSVELVMAFEEEFDIEIGDDEMEAVKTVSDAERLVGRKLASRLQS